MKVPWPRRLLLVVAASLEGAARAVRRAARPATPAEPTDGPPQAPDDWTSRTQSSGPPAHWLARVRAGAPWLLGAPEQVAVPPQQTQRRVREESAATGLAQQTEAPAMGVAQQAESPVPLPETPRMSARVTSHPDVLPDNETQERQARDATSTQEPPRRLRLRPTPGEPSDTMSVRRRIEDLPTPAPSARTPAPVNEAMPVAEVERRRSGETPDVEPVLRVRWAEVAPPEPIVGSRPETDVPPLPRLPQRYATWPETRVPEPPQRVRRDELVQQPTWQRSRVYWPEVSEVPPSRSVPATSIAATDDGEPWASLELDEDLTPSDDTTLGPRHEAHLRDLDREQRGEW
jgi:hypothetical protein